MHQFSDRGRSIERKMPGSFQYGMQRFHRAVSLTLLILASLILTVEVCMRTRSTLSFLALYSLEYCCSSVSL